MKEVRGDSYYMINNHPRKGSVPKVTQEHRDATDHAMEENPAWEEFRRSSKDNSGTHRNTYFDQPPSEDQALGGVDLQEDTVLPASQGRQQTQETWMGNLPTR